MYRRRGGEIEVFLVHPGGPFWSKKDAGAWSIPKGEYETGDDPLDTAKRELREETGCEVSGDLVPLAPQKQAGGKVVTAWAAEGNCDESAVVSNTFTMEWPPRSGRMRTFPEVDRAGWFTLPAAREKILKGQAGFLDELEGLLAGPGSL